MSDLSDENSVQRIDRASERNDNNPRPAQRAQLLLHHHDAHVRENPPFRTFTEIALSEIKKEGTVFQRLKCCYIDVQIL